MLKWLSLFVLVGLPACVEGREPLGLKHRFKNDQMAVLLFENKCSHEDTKKLIHKSPYLDQWKDAAGLFASGGFRGCWLEVKKGQQDLEEDSFLIVFQDGDTYLLPKKSFDVKEKPQGLSV